MTPQHYLSDRSPPSERRYLNDLHALNRQFLSLLLTRGGEEMEDDSLRALATLAEDGLDRLARCPYSLFDLRLTDAGFWERQPDGREEPAAEAVADDPLRTAFVLAALLYARQMAGHAPELARLLLGMSNGVGKVLLGMNLQELTTVTVSGQGLLTARLAQHPHFWPDLMDFVRDGSKERYLAARTRGVQQLASKLTDRGR